MSAKHLTPETVGRTVHVIDTSGVVDLAYPPRQPGEVGRIGAIRDNTRLLFIGMHLCTRLGHETTVRGAHQVLTESIDRDVQWDLGVLRPLTSAAATTGVPFDPDTPALVKAGKPRKRIWADDGVEEIGYDDLYNAATALRKRLDYGLGAAPDLDDAERTARQAIVEQIIDALIGVTTIPRTGTTWAIDATGQWAWTRGPSKRKKELEKELTKLTPEEPEPNALEVADFAIDDDGDTAPTDQTAPAPAAARGRCLDAAWGYKTSKSGEKEVGFGFHQHTICRVPDPGADDEEPILVDGFVITPANADVVAASLGLIDRIRTRHSFTRLLGDLLYTNLKGGRWAVPLANRGIEQGLSMRSDNHKVVDINGAQLQHGWLHCAAAPMDQRPLPPDYYDTPEEWETFHVEVEKFRANWAFDRKESGLLANPTSKWICPASAQRRGCWALGATQVQAATDLGLPIITPPSDWETRTCCTNKTMDFTPEPDNPDHQRKLMQREYFGSRRWRGVFKRRPMIEGVFGILKNASRQRLRRGQNRLPGVAFASIIAAIKTSLFNEEQMRSWHDRTGLGPGDHPLLQPDPPYWGFRNLTKAEAKAIDAKRLKQLRDNAAQPAGRAA